jgi:hypothetical protein
LIAFAKKIRALSATRRHCSKHAEIADDSTIYRFRLKTKNHDAQTQQDYRKMQHLLNLASEHLVSHISSDLQGGVQAKSKHIHRGAPRSETKEKPIHLTGMIVTDRPQSRR